MAVTVIHLSFIVGITTFVGEIKNRIFRLSHWQGKLWTALRLHGSTPIETKTKDTTTQSYQTWCHPVITYIESNSVHLQVHASS